ncbi:MAG: septum formation initiator family protein [Anaerolineae bacterium]|nr:septum formation initiator family protein [Anaerolineae bacterium]
MILATIVLLVVLGIGYMQRVAASQAVQAELEQWQQRVKEARLQRERLEKELSYAQTDLYVDERARTAFGWVRPGDVPVEVIVESPEPFKQEPQRAEPSLTSHWRQWWELFFGP